METEGGEGGAHGKYDFLSGREAELPACNAHGCLRKPCVDNIRKAGVVLLQLVVTHNTPSTAAEDLQSPILCCACSSWAFRCPAYQSQITISCTDMHAMLRCHQQRLR